VKIEQHVTTCFEEWREPVYRYLVASFGYPAQADEITQETFPKLYRTLRQGETIANTRAWVFRVAHNLAVDQLRGRKFVTSLSEEEWVSLRQSLTDGAPSPEEQLLGLERNRRLDQAIAALALQERQCLHLRLRGLRYREIAEVLGTNIPMVARTLQRVIEQLARKQ
jgi:RNA polymerase sigma-70 factor (ECF subfamily)